MEELPHEHHSCSAGPQKAELGSNQIAVKWEDLSESLTVPPRLFQRKRHLLLGVQGSPARLQPLSSVSTIMAARTKGPKPDQEMEMEKSRGD